jgi:cytochrome c oxidase cbb3-type subunit III
MSSGYRPVWGRAFSLPPGFRPASGACTFRPVELRTMVAQALAWGWTLDNFRLSQAEACATIWPKPAVHKCRRTTRWWHRLQPVVGQASACPAQTLACGPRGFRPPLVAVTIFLALACAGCTGPATEVAVEGDAPPIGIPVGPVPGAAIPLNTGQNPYAQNKVGLAEGRMLFVSYNCYGCHGGHAGGGMGPSLRNGDWIYGGADYQVFNSIAQGRAHGMPAWGTKLPEDQIWKLTAYVKSLRTPNEPDPPE